MRSLLSDGKSGRGGGSGEGGGRNRFSQMAMLNTPNKDEKGNATTRKTIREFWDERKAEGFKAGKKYAKDNNSINLNLEK
jgi:hypothetical protein